jgi:hypothetical protein
MALGVSVLMPTFSGWSEGQPDAIAEIISYKSVSTGTITRGSGTVSAKTVRLETLSGQRQVQGPNGQTYMIDAFILAPLATGLLPGDIFTVASQTFEVEMLMPGHIDCEQYYLRLRR